MLKISQLKAYSQSVKDTFPEVNRCRVVVTQDELFKFMKEHTQEENILMVALVPQHGVTGSQGNTQWTNSTGFLFLEKTSYSDHDHESYLGIFERTGDVAEKFVHKLQADKADNTGLFCGFLAFLNERSIKVDPVKAVNGCNGHIVQLAFNSSM